MKGNSTNADNFIETKYGVLSSSVLYHFQFIIDHLLPRNYRLS